MATYAIGDIQGCYDELLLLLEQFNFSDSDQLWFAGDLVNRGPKSLETLRFVKSLGDRAKVILGNHDLHFLAVAYDQAPPHHSDTLDEILKADDREELLLWLRHQPLLYHDDQFNHGEPLSHNPPHFHDQQRGYTMVHAGISPNWDLQQAKHCAQEVERVLQSDDYLQYFATMYGNEPNRWSNDLTGTDRWRCITNHFTRMRFCDAEGNLEFKTMSSDTSPLPGFLPWFTHPQRQTKNDPIIFGHWAALEGKAETQNIFALDTGCVWGGTLTAMRLEDRQLFSVSSPGYAGR